MENQLTVNTDYYAGKLVSDTVVRTYGSTDWDIRSGLPVREIYKYSDGKKKKCDYTYPYHVNDAVGRAMTAANDILRPAHIGESVEGPEGYMDDSLPVSTIL